MATTVEYTNYLSNDELGSTALSDAWYDELARRLYVRFHTGSVAGYRDVPRHVWYEFASAPSKGSYYSYNIKHNFSGVDARDVTFVKASDPSLSVAGPSNANFRVVVKYDGTLEFNVKASDVKAAIDEVDKVLAKHGRGSSVFVKVESL